MADQNILVIGAALVDFIGNYRSDDEDLVSRAGPVSISIGGAAFNIAANLAAKHNRASLVTVCKRRSPTTALIKGACRSIGLDHRWIIEDGQTAWEPAYVALKKDESVVHGVTSSPIERADLFISGILEKAIRASALVVTETNLHLDQLRRVADICYSCKKRLCVMAVSDAKANRLVGGRFPLRFSLVSMNVMEAEAAGIRIDPANKPGANEIRDICDRVNAESVIVTFGKIGFVILDHHGEFGVYPARDTEVESVLGAGDAVFAAACVSVLERDSLTSPASLGRIYGWSTEVLGRQEANLALVDLSPTENPDRWPLMVFGMTAACGLLISLAMVLGNNSETLFWTFLILSSLSGGILGSLLRDAIHSIRGSGRTMEWRFPAIGAAVGLVAGILNALPNVATQDLPYRDGSLNVVTLAAFIAGFIAGLAFEAMLSQWGGGQSDRETA